MSGVYISSEEWLAVRRNSVLISIDFVLFDPGKEQVLLGLRKNAPAQGCWFVPGGRIRKDEEFYEAARRICESELGKKNTRVLGKLKQGLHLGIFQHGYIFEEDGKEERVHYLANGIALPIKSETLDSFPNDQHKDYRWFPFAELKTSIENMRAGQTEAHRGEVHPNNLLYFNRLFSYINLKQALMPVGEIVQDPLLPPPKSPPHEWMSRDPS